MVRKLASTCAYVGLTEPLRGLTARKLQRRIG